MVVETRKRKASRSLSKPDDQASSSKSASANKTPVPLSITGGTFTTPDWLPTGLAVVVLAKATGHKFKVYKEIATGKKFYSKTQVLNYFGMARGTNSSKRKVKVASPQIKQVSTISTKPLEIPEDLYDLIGSAARVRNSLKLNSNDSSAKRELESLESKIHIVSTCCKYITEDLPSDWIYDPETSLMAYVPKFSTSPKPKTEKKKKKKKEKMKQEIQITWSSPNYHGKYPFKNDELKVWNFFMSSTEEVETLEYMVVGVGEELNMVDKDDKVVDLLGKFSVDTFNRSCQMYVNKDEDSQVSGAEFMECKFYKFASKYIFYMTIEAIEQGILGVYETRVECNSDGAKKLMNFRLTDRKPKWNRPWVKPCLEPAVEYETVQDGSSDPQDYYELTGLVHRETEGGGFNYHNPRFSSHTLVYTSRKDESTSDFKDFENFVPNVTRPL